MKKKWIGPALPPGFAYSTTNHPDSYRDRCARDDKDIELLIPTIPIAKGMRPVVRLPLKHQ